MHKKIIACFFVTAFLFFLSACGLTPTDNKNETAHDGDPLAQGFHFILRGNILHLDMDIHDALALLGEPLDTFDRPSCAFDGADRFFLFPGVQIQTYPAGGQDRVHTVMFMDDSVATVNGIRLGSSLDALLAAYGNDYEYAYGMYTYVRGATTLRFLVGGGEVRTISYELIVK
jgi:hypothetical protein